jgi:hypothetical protein
MLGYLNNSPKAAAFGAPFEACHVHTRAFRNLVVKQERFKQHVRATDLPLLYYIPSFRLYCITSRQDGQLS